MKLFNRLHRHAHSKGKQQQSDQGLFHASPFLAHCVCLDASRRYD